MKKSILLILMLFGVIVNVQAQFCDNFNQNQPGAIQMNGVQPGGTSNTVPNLLDNWGSRCGDLQYDNVGSQNGANDVFLRAFDRGCSDGSSWMFNSTDYNGNWIQFINGGANCFCYDFRMFNGGGGTTSTSLRIYNGADPFTSTLRARFQLNQLITVQDGWQTICAPVGLVDANGNPPANAVGTWIMEIGTDWDALIQNIGGIAYVLDITSSPTEVYGFDNICIGACTGTGCTLTSQVSNIVCYDQGTTDPSDDTWTFDLTVNNPDGTGTTWNATTPNADSGGYGNTTTIDMGNISNLSGTFNFLVADDGDPSCSTQVAVQVPEPCSPPCDLDYTFTIGECDDNGTPSDYSDDFYYVTVTVTGTNGLSWMAKQKLESNGVENVLDNVTGDVTDYQLGPIDVSDGDWTLWIGLTDYSDCLKDEFINVPNCCNDEPYIIPHWNHPDCPEVVCIADQWPVHVLSSDGSTIENGFGVTVVWDNLDTPTNENDIQDFIYVSAEENWQATITYPNGCEYVVTYYEDCCDEDIYIKVIECPSTSQLQAYQAVLKTEMEAAMANRSAATKSVSQAQQAQIQGELDKLSAYMEALAKSDGDGCDPCELEYIFIQLVDANGDPIDINDYDSFSWDHNGSQATNVLVDLPMENGPICFTATNTEYGKVCTYQDCFFYECEEECLCDDLVLGDLNVNQVSDCLYSISASSIVNCSSDQIADEEYSFTINGGAPITSSGNGIYHTFTANGTYDITMSWTVTDIEGCETTVSISDTVKIDCVEDPCEPATDLEFNCRRAGMSWTGNPALTYIVEVTWDDPDCCRSKYPPTATRWEVTGTSTQLPFIKKSDCFSWKVGIKCEGEILWSRSQCIYCYGDGKPTKPHEEPSDVKTSAKISPNPNDGNMNIEISGEDKTDFTIKVYRFDGILIKSFDTNRIENQNTTISWNGKSVLTPGMYFFVITTDSETITKKVIIE
ncbi:T9SS type A sorting domain-containing protein [uncultured Kordia sp.]|uniref:T9SS type A sorting domain-containing protein n=1 Tax=uncultured Kordia sp. TaxID=507699 RepID=UPI0026380C46|nr:T9SS type A sorting domain-containing protein [uncultured Kordia sp.]